MEQPLVIRLSIEHMQAQILQAIYPREIELKEHIEQAVQRAIDSFDFNAEVERQVISTLRNDMQRRVQAALYTAFARKGMDELDKQIESEVERQLRGK
jgi:hypothetical protein